MLEGGQIIGFDWRYLYVNEAAARQGRSSRDAFLGRTMMEAYPGIENTSVFAVLRCCMMERTPGHLENEFTFPDGTVGWFELSIQPVQDGIFILSVDITARKRAEAGLREAHELLQRRAMELEAFNRAMVGRVQRIIEMKEEVNALCQELGREPEYPPVWRKDSGPHISQAADDHKA